MHISGRSYWFTFVRFYAGFLFGTPNTAAAKV